MERIHPNISNTCRDSGNDEVFISTKQIIKLVMRADPNPNHCVAMTLANGAILFVDAGRPNVIITTELLETPAKDDRDFERKAHKRGALLFGSVRLFLPALLLVFQR
jgi:hypothetical protein